MTGFSIERKISWGTIISAAVQMVLLVAFIAGLNYRVDAAQRDITDIKAAQISITTSVASLETRSTALEINQKNGSDQGQQFQQDMKQALGDVRAAVNELRVQNVQMLQALAALNATLSRKSDQ